MELCVERGQFPLMREYVLPICCAVDRALNSAKYANS